MPSQIRIVLGAHGLFSEYLCDEGEGAFVDYDLANGEKSPITHQDFWAGEMVNLATPPAGRYLTNGLQWHGWTCLDVARWVYEDQSTVPHPPLYSDRELLDFLSLCRRHRAPMCFNLLAFQDGSVFEESVAQLARIRRALSSHA